MTDYQKKEIQLLLAAHVKMYKSQKTAADSLTNVSEATLIQVKSNRWENISDQMWRNIGKQVGYTANGKWNMAPTRPFNMLVKLLTTAQENALTQAIVWPSGRGKSFCMNWIQQHKQNIFHVVCAEYMSSKDLLAKILRKMGKDPIGTASVMMETIIETVLKLEEPMIILDEFDKLKDKQKLFFITLYNMLGDHSALILMGTMNLELQIRKKTGKHTLGYEEIYSRISRRFITLPESNLKDVTEICEANGLYDPAKVQSIYNEFEGDLRRVKTAVLKARIQSSKQTHLEVA